MIFKKKQKNNGARCNNKRLRFSLVKTQIRPGLSFQRFFAWPEDPLLLCVGTGLSRRRVGFRAGFYPLQVRPTSTAESGSVRGSRRAFTGDVVENKDSTRCAVFCKLLRKVVRAFRVCVCVVWMSAGVSFDALVVRWTLKSRQRPLKSSPRSFFPPATKLM